MKLSSSRLRTKTLGTKALGVLGAGLALILGLALANTASAEPRVALVIGNSAYEGDLPALTNPANDARLMARTLKSVGFDVVEAEDASADEIKQAIASFSLKLSAAGSEGTGLFFYAGHGVQVGGENYMIPVDAKLKREADVALQAVAASTVLQQMDFAGSAVNIIILDACRNNPLPSSERSASRGLAEIKTTPRGSFIAYSTAPGSTAADGDGANSPYTKALAETITQPGLSIADVFQEVRTKVLASTGNTQTPWDSSSLTGRFYFKPPEASQTAAVAPTPTAPAEPDAFDYEKTYWESVKDSSDPDDFQAYLTKYPQGAYAEVAQFKLDKLKGATTQVASAEPASAGRESMQAPEANQPAAPAAPSSNMSFILQDQTVYAKSGGQVRAAPSAKATLLSKLQANTEVKATGLSTDGKWWRVALVDGQTGYMHNSVVTEQPAQTAAAQPAPPRTLGADALEVVAAPQPAPAPSQGGDAASQFFQGLAQQAAQQMGLPVEVPPIATQPAQQQAASSLSFDEIYETIEIRQGATIFNAAGGQAIYSVKQTGPFLATAQSSDGRWYKVSLPTGGEGYVPRQSVVN